MHRLYDDRVKARLVSRHAANVGGPLSRITTHDKIQPNRIKWPRGIHGPVDFGANRTFQADAIFIAAPFHDRERIIPATLSATEQRQEHVAMRRYNLCIRLGMKGALDVRDEFRREHLVVGSTNGEHGRRRSQRELRRCG